MNPLDLSARVSDLELKLRQASHDYYNGTPSVTDEVYDAWRDELVELSAHSPEVVAIGSPAASEWVKVRHSIPMGSLNKVQTPDELKAWVLKLTRRSDEKYVLIEKLDGISVSLCYEKGSLTQALTRGDGLIGEDITSNVRRMKGIPQLDPGMNDTLYFRGEIVMLKDDHKRHFPDKANPRNAASGTSKRLDGKGSEHLTVLVYQLEGTPIESEELMLCSLQSMGFLVPNWSSHTSAGSMVAEWERYQQGFRDTLPYEIDGLVARLEDQTYQMELGDVHGRPNGSVAFKFNPPSRETTIREIVWQVGSIGRITPVAVFNPVNLLGAEVSRASLYNQKYIEQLGVDVGARVLVTRANDVIPRVSQVVVSKGSVAQAPKACPVCGGPTALDGEYVICSDVMGCPAQTVGRIKQWVGEHNILEWGDTLIQRLVDEGLVKTVADLYRLKKEQLAALERMGDRSAEVVLTRLWASTPMALENFLGALSIPLCATSIVRLVVDAGYDSLEKVLRASVEQLQDIPGLGPKRAEAIHNGVRKNQRLIMDLLDVGVKVKARAVGTLTGKSVCFTGKSVRKRAELELLATNSGGSVKNSVGKGLTYLVMADPDSGSSKAVAARKNGTSCISEEAFVAMCGGT